MHWIIWLLILGALGVILLVLIRKIPQLRVIDVNSITKERERKVKEKIILSKIQRSGGAKLGAVAKTSASVVRVVSKYGRRAVQRLYNLEQYYQKLRRSASEGIHAYDTDRIRGRIDEAQELIRQDEYIPAEKIFIDIISHNPKNVVAYEGLGNMYIKSEQFDQARETLSFALRLSPNDASVRVSLAELELLQGNPQTALPHLREAVQKRSKNPKYLDFYIDTALTVGSLKDARAGLASLKEVNPENKKIKEFEERFREKKDEYIRKTSTSTPEPSQDE
jgi:predicted Zn-dependent protease